LKLYLVEDQVVLLDAVVVDLVLVVVAVDTALRQFMQTVVTLLLVLPNILSVLVQVVGVHVVDAVMDELVVDSTDVLLMSKVVD
tara:strand:- start:395 stop:646 length:252 start_codon:yes stop_codon:yes gene_type:complete